MTEFERDSSEPTFETEQIHLFVQKPEHAFTLDTPFTLKADFADSAESQPYIAGIRADISSQSEKFTAVVVPRTAQSADDIQEKFIATQCFLQNAFEDKYDDTAYIETPTQASYIKVDDVSYVEVRAIINEANNLFAFGLRTVDIAEVSEIIDRPLTAQSDVHKGPRAKLGSYIETLAFTAASLIPVVEIEDDDGAPLRPDQVSIGLTKELVKPNDTFPDNILQLMSRPGSELAVLPEEPEVTEQVIRERFNHLEISLRRIGGHETVKDRLRTIAAAVIDPDTAQHYNIKASHFYLYGPAGTGKTTLINAFANGLGADLVTLKGSELDGKYYGEPAKNITEAIEQAVKDMDTRPVVVFIDEIDMLIGNRSDPNGHYKNVIKTMNTELDELSATYPNQIIVVGATNALPSELDSSVTRSGRMEGISVPAPTQAELHEVIAAIFADSAPASDIDDPIYAPDVNIAALIPLIDDMTGADFRKVLENSRAEKHFVFLKTRQHSPVSHADIVRHLDAFKKK